MNSIDSMIDIFKRQKEQALQLRGESLVLRKEKLLRLKAALYQFEPQILDALKKDLGRSDAESLLTEIQAVHHELKYFLKNLKCWMQPRRVGAPWPLWGTRNWIQCEPKGAVLIISPWNYPVNLALNPLIAALAAGNTVILKPSELAPYTSSVLETLIQATFKETEVAVFTGDARVSENLLKLPFDHIFFTGSTKVGRLVMLAAAQNLTPVTLELGGKSPAIIDDSCDLELTAKKIVWGKFINAGQTCVAPDYLLVQKNIYQKFLELLKKNIYEMYGEPRDLKSNSSYCKIISPGHYHRLKTLLSQSLETQGSIEEGGQFFDEEQKIAPTLISHVDPSSPVMQEEIFGPLLPLLPYQTLGEVVHFINARPKPLSLYLFSKTPQHIEQILKHTSAGSVAINEVVLQLLNPCLPFGGVGESGIGHYHGVYGFRTFSHEKAILKQGCLGRLLTSFYPPYTTEKLRRVKWLLGRWTH